MNLYIGNSKTSDGTCMCLPYSLLEDKAVHLFIASNMWDKLIVDVDEEIPDGVLTYMILKCKEKEAVLPDRKLTQRELGLVCEMYPDRAGSIRKASITNRPVAELLA